MSMSKVDIIFFEPQSLEWLNARKERVTGTEVSTLFGLNKYMSPAKLLQTKIESTTEIQDNVYMMAGRFLEPAILADLNNYGIEAKHVHEKFVAFVVHKTVPLSVSLDGKAKYNGKHYIVECKTTSGSNKALNISKIQAWHTEIPLNYYMQVQAQMLCTGVKQAIIACVEAVMPFPMVAWEIQEDQKLFRMIEEEVLKFFECYKNKQRFLVDKTKKKYVEESWKQYSNLLIGQDYDGQE